MLKFEVYNMYDDGKEDVEKKTSCRTTLLKDLFNKEAVWKFSFKFDFIPGIPIK